MYVDYIVVLDALSQNPGFTNVVTNASHHSVYEVIFVIGLSRNSRRQMTRLEHKSFVLMKHFMNRFPSLFCWCLTHLLEPFSSASMCIARKIKAVLWMLQEC